MLFKSNARGAAVRGNLAMATFGLFLLAVVSQVAAEPITIGRSSLTLPDLENWKVQDAEATDLNYSGDLNGALVMGSKVLSYLSADKLTKAVVSAKVTKGGLAGGSMTWTNNCPTVKEGSVTFKIDNGTVSNIDCLVVVKVNRIDSFVNAVPRLKGLFNDERPNTKDGFYIQCTKSIGAGGYTRSEALLASDFKGIDGEVIKNQTTIPPAVLSWAVAFAKSNAAAVDSLSGKWSIPALVFNPK